MFAIRLEGFGEGSGFQTAVREACAEVERRSALAQQITRPGTRRAMEAWFGDADLPEVWANVGRLLEVIRDPARRVTFVNAVGKVIRVDYNPDNIAQAPTSSQTVPTPEDMRGVSAWVYPTLVRAGSGGQVGSGAPLFHTGSGMRLYLGYATVMQSTIGFDDLVHTIYHELSHKVIGTNDHEYGAGPSQALIADGRALRNADNYAFFLMALD